MHKTISNHYQLVSPPVAAVAVVVLSAAESAAAVVVVAVNSVAEYSGAAEAELVSAVGAVWPGVAGAVLVWAVVVVVRDQSVVVVLSVVVVAAGFQVSAAVEAGWQHYWLAGSVTSVWVPV